ncbi:sensor histidine kinase [Leptospira brenneri]|nr:7TM diverse intracellular signaling domain-containing protein [Leptospira brenneri]
MNQNFRYHFQQMKNQSPTSWIPPSALTHILLLLVALTLISCTTESTDKGLPKVIDGKMDLSAFYLKNQTIIKLDGDWDFYYEKLLLSEDFQKRNPPLQKETITLPGFWNEKQKDGKSYSTHGFATFRMQLTLPKSLEKSQISFYIPHAFNTYRMYANGILISENGIVGTSASETKEHWLPKLTFFTPHSEFIEIIVHVANYQALNSGFRQSIELGSEETMIQTKQIRLALDIFLIASLFVISLYHFTLFLLRKNDRSLLYFSIYSCVSLVYKLTSGEFFLIILFPNFEWQWLIKIFFLSVYLAPPFLISFIGEVFPEETNQLTKHTFQFIFTVFAIFILVCDFVWVEETLLPAEIFMLFCSIFILWILSKAVIKKRENAWGFLLGYIFLFLTILNDILFEKNIIKTEVYAPIGTFVLFFSQSFLLSKKSSKLYFTVEKQNKELEQTVFLKDKIHHTNIHSKRMELELYKKTIQPHFLLNSLSAIRYWVSENPEKSALILDSLAEELHIILKVASKQLIPVSEEINLCKYHIGVMKLRMEKDYKLKISRFESTDMIPPLVFHTLIENAFTHEDSEKAKLSFGIFMKNITENEKSYSSYHFLVYHHNKEKETKPTTAGTGTGLEYIRLRLEESYPGKWSLTHGKSKKGYRVLILIQKN